MTSCPCCTACAAASIAVSSSPSSAVGNIVVIARLLPVGSSCQPGGQEARAPGQVAVVTYLLPPSGTAEHRGRRLPLGVGVLDADHSPRPQEQRRTLRDDPDRVETVAGGVQRELGVVVADLGGHRLPRL